jgi:hypothetical protein
MSYSSDDAGTNWNARASDSTLQHIDSGDAQAPSAMRSVPGLISNRVRIFDITFAIRNVSGVCRRALADTSAEPWNGVALKSLSRFDARPGLCRRGKAEKERRSADSRLLILPQYRADGAVGNCRVSFFRWGVTSKPLSVVPIGTAERTLHVFIVKSKQNLNLRKQRVLSVCFF